MIGCGGGSLATMLDKTGVRVTIVDINPTAFFTAQRLLHQLFRLLPGDKPETLKVTCNIICHLCWRH